jgi:hypothetical protein
MKKSKQRTNIPPNPQKVRTFRPKEKSKSRGNLSR